MGKKKVVYENEPLPSGFSTADIEFRTPDGGETDIRLAVRKRNGVWHFRTDSELTNSKIYEIGKMKYKVNAVFSFDSKLTVQDNIKHLLSADIDNIS